MRGATGQTSPVHTLQARTKLLLFGVLSLGLFLMNDPWRVAGLLAYLILVLALARMPWRTLGKRLLPLAWFLAITVAAQVFLTRGRILAEGPWGWPRVTAEGLEAGILLSIRVAALVGMSLLLTATTPMANLARDGARCLAPLGWLRVPVRELAQMATLALRFVPELLGEGRRVLVAQRLRGMEQHRGPWGTATRLFPVIAPVFTASFRRSQQVAAAMEARGFGRRTAMPSEAWQWQDGVAVALTIGVVVICWWWP